MAILSAVLILSALVCHGLLLRVPPIFDDTAFVFDNRLVIGPWPGLYAFFGATFSGGEYEPLMELFHWGLHHLFGASVLPYRATSLLLHWGVVLLFWRLARRYLDEFPALAAAALFAVYPGHIEVLALTSFKKHLAVSFFGLALLNIQQEERLRAPARAAVGALLLAAGFLCKESAAVFVLLAVAAAALPDGTSGWRRQRVFLGSLLAVCFLYALLRVSMLPRIIAPLVGGDCLTHGLTCGKIFLWHLGQLCLPTSLALEHSLHPVAGPWEGAAVILGVLGWGTLGVLLWRRDRVAAFAWFWVSAALLPFLNLIPYLNFSLVANRYDYMASAAFLLLVCRLLQEILRSRSPRAGSLAALAAAVVFAAYTLLGMRYAVLFSSPFDLWKDSERSAPDHPRVHAALGGLYAAQHDLATAERELRRAIVLSPALPESYVPLAWVLAETGRSAEALELSRFRISLRGDPLAWGSYGQLLVREGRFAEALPALEKFRQMRPGPYSDLALAQCLLGLGRIDRAEGYLLAARQDPELSAKVLRGLGHVEFKRGHREAGLKFWEQSLQTDPLQFELVEQLSRLDRAPGWRSRMLKRYDDYLGRLEGFAWNLQAETPEQRQAMRSYIGERLTEAKRARDRSARLSAGGHHSAAGAGGTP